MTLPHPKVLIPALFGLVAGAPMLMQASMGSMALPASVTDVAQQEGIDADALLDADVKEADYGYEIKHYLRRSQHLGSCSDTWKSINKGIYLLCKRTLAEMGGSDRQNEITRVLRRTNSARMHSAPTTGKKINDRFGVLESARPESAEDLPRFRFRRDGSMTLPQDE